MKTTPFTEKHIALGAKMHEFAGYNMPIEYSGIIDEHITVCQGVGVFDVSHMGEFWVKGPQALAFLQKITSNNVAALAPGKIQYTCFPNEDGGIVDDLLVYQYEPEKYMLVVNASNMEKDWNWCVSHNTEGAELENSRIFQLGSLRIVRNTPVPVFFHIGSIHHQHVFFRFILINQQIIYNPPILIRKTSILYFTRSQCRHIVRCYFLQKGQRLRSFHPKFSHVRYIKYTDTLTNSYVFINDTGVFNRHIITCKLVHFSTKCYMFLCKRSGFHYFKVLSFKYQVLSITGAYRLFIWKPPVLLFLRSLSLLSPYSG